MDKIDIVKKSGERVQVLRKSRNMTQFELAERMGVDVRQIRKIETGEFKNGASLLHIYMVSLVFEISLSELFDFQE